MIIPRGRRRLDRVTLPVPEWRGLVDDDLDQNERDHADIRQEFAEQLKTAIAPFVKSQDRTNQILLTLLLTVGGGLILAIATNLLTK